MKEVIEPKRRNKRMYYNYRLLNIILKNINSTLKSIQSFVLFFFYTHY